MKRNRRGPGQSLVEFALVLPVILFLVIVFIDLARVIYYYSALTSAVREGARYAIIGGFGSSTSREQQVRERVTTFAVALPIDPGDISVYCDRDTTDLDYPCDKYVTVAAEVEIEPMVGFFAQMIGAGSTYNITAESTMQMTPYGISN